MKKNTIEMIVGLFLIVGLACMAYTSIKLGQIEFFDSNYYPLKASFTSASGLKPDTYVQISGVNIGKVQSIHLENYQAVVIMNIEKGVNIQDDAIASIRTNGILGEKYIDILPGGSSSILKPGEEIFDTEPPFDLLSVINKLVVK